MSELRPNPEHDRLFDLPIADILCVAPAGCGKTTALAGRARALAMRGDVSGPRRILALSFTNRARSNLAAQLRRVMGPRYWEHVTVTNFHGFAARLIRAHGAVIGLSPDLRMPERAWRSRVMREMRLTWRERERVDAILDQAKRSCLSDDEVLSAIQQSHCEEAILYERRLRDEHRLDYEDLLRHAEALLSVNEVASRYRLHFPVVFVDEIQDLTMRQFRLAASLGEGKLTAAGDRAQGIYRFAGAEPNRVFEAIAARSPIVVEFSRSYRSAPSILKAVNALAEQVGGSALACAHPEDWNTPGRVADLRRRTDAEEAAALLSRITDIIHANPLTTVGVIVRRSGRRTAFLSEARKANLDFELWDDPTHHRTVVALMKRHILEATGSSAQRDQQLDALRELCKSEIAADDPELLDDLASALESLNELMAEGMELARAVKRCRSAPIEDVPVPTGLHVLNGHLGKGLQFDWVVVMGLEEGYIPDFRESGSQSGLEEELRVLHVMASRAR